MREAVVGIGGGLLLVGLILVTAPWWVTSVGWLVERWGDWVTDKIEAIEERRERRRNS